MSILTIIYFIAFCGMTFSRVGQHLLQALLCYLPVNNIPDRLEVFGLAVLVLQAYHH